jgi:hypothetical protein
VAYNNLADPTVMTDTAVRTISVDFAGKTTSLGDADFAHATTSFSDGTVTLTADTAGIASGLESVAAIAAASASAAGDIKLIAQQTATADLPGSGTVVYTGIASALVNVTDSNNTYDATMDTEITADFNSAGFGAQTVDVILSNATNVTQLQVSGGVPVAYAGVDEEVRLRGLDISGNSFADGTGTTAEAFGWDGGTTNLIQGAQTITATGVFAGDDAREIAGVGIASGASSGSFTVIFTGSE